MSAGRDAGEGSAPARARFHGGGRGGRGSGRVRRAVAVAAACLVAGGTAMTSLPAAHAESNTRFPVAWARQSSPQWFFARAKVGWVKRDSCWPAQAINGDGSQAAAASLKDWPTAGQGGCPSANSAFPTYFTVKRCTRTEVRVGYTLFFPKDGFTVGGHAYDFESAVVVWRLRSGRWQRDRLLMSRHGAFVGKPWSSVWWDGADNGRQRPRLYVGWGKHAIFNEEGGSPAGVLNDELRNGAYSADANSWLVEVRKTARGNGRNWLAARFDEKSWGSANTTPAVLAQRLCSVSG